MRPEELSQLNRSNDIEIGTLDIPACSIMPQPTTLPCAPRIKSNLFKAFMYDGFSTRIVPLRDMNVCHQAAVLLNKVRRPRELASRIPGLTAVLMKSSIF
jgi:hypothetical protein